MCRLLAIRSSRNFNIQTHLEKFARISRDSVEYQGHGWGCSFIRSGKWHHHHSIEPIWKDQLDIFGESTLLVAHARSAFQNEGISIENNMPFIQGNRVFIFNGEIRGVRLKVEGRIGAEKIFNLIQRLDRGNLKTAVSRALKILETKSAKLKACNVILATPEKLLLTSRFTERAEYFTMHRVLSDPLIICSERYPVEHDEWRAVAEGSVEEV